MLTTKAMGHLINMYVNKMIKEAETNTINVTLISYNIKRGYLMI